MSKMASAKGVEVAGMSLEKIRDIMDNLILKDSQYSFIDFEDHIDGNGSSDFRNDSLVS